MTVPDRVRIVEVGPRDGLQNEPAQIAAADKIAFVDRLSDAGHGVIEVSAFVSPKWVPQMADAAEVFAGITRRPGTRYSALVPNAAGLTRAIRPSPGARTGSSIFIASSTISVWPAVTVSPGATLTLTTVAGIGDESEPCDCWSRRRAADGASIRWTTPS